MGKIQTLLVGAAMLALGQAAHASALPTYTFDQAPTCGSWCYYDTAMSKLTDGVTGQAGWAVNHGAEWVGWYPVPVVNITFQFGQSMNFSSVTIGSTQDALNDVVLPSFQLWAFEGGSWVSKGVISNPPSSANNNDPYATGPHAVFTFSALNFTTEQVRITATSEVQGTFIFVDEVSFNSAAPVPEPGTWAMLLAGLGTTGLMLRGRARTQPQRRR
jgi:hypothetical protein